MDVLEQYLGGGKTAAAPPPNPIVNNPGNLRPIGASTGFQKFATPEEGISAADKNLKAYGDKGINTLRGVISRYAPPSENDTNAYIDTVAKRIGLDPDQKIDLSDPVQRHVISGAMFTVEKGSKNLFKTGQQPAAAAAQTTQPVSSDPLENYFLGKAPVAAQPPVQPPAQPGQTVAAPAAAQTPAAPGQTPPSRIADIASQTFNRYQDVKRNLGERVAGAIDTAYGGIVPAAYGAFVQAGVRPYKTPQEAEAIGQAAAASIDKPLGKAMGITGSEAYQKPLGGITEPIAQQVNKMFNVLGMTPEQISEKTGIPPQDIRNMVVIGSAAIPQGLKEAGQIAKASPLGKKIGEAAAELEIVKPGQLTKEQMQAQFEAAQGKAPAGSVGAAAAQNNPYFGKITGEETVRGQFPQVKLSKTPTDAPLSEQMTRSQLIQEIMPGEGVRPGVVTGNENLLRNEYTKAKLDTPEGRVFKEKIANEQAALSRYAEERVNATGASRSLINDEQRGQSINDVIHGVSPEGAAPSSLMGYFKDSKKQIYDSAFKRVGNNQIKTANTDSFFNNAQQLATAEKDGTLNFLNGAKKEIELAKTVGYELPDGKIAPANSVAALDAVIKSNNAAWTPEKANTIRKINAAINKDIAAVADPSLYKLGDKIHRLEKELFESRGIDKIFGEVDKNGVVTSATALEKIPSKLNNMPKDQWRHIRDTLNELASGRIRNAPEGMPPIPPELMQSAKAAVAEIDGALAREIQKAGAAKMGEWNQNSTNNVMNSIVGQKILETFPPSEIQKFHTLNYAGQLMPGIHGYEGAALQARRVSMLEKNLGKLGTGAGAAIGGYIAEAPGAAVGAYVLGEAGVKASEKMAQKALTKEAAKAQKEMQEAAKLGRQTGQNRASDMLNKK